MKTSILKWPDFYHVVAFFDDEDEPLGSACDPKSSRELAFKEYRDCLLKGRIARVFHTSFDVETNAYETCTEVTSDFFDLYLEWQKEAA